MWSTSPGTHQRRICHSNGIFSLLLNLLKGVQTTYYYSHIDLFLQCVAMMADRYRIQGFRNSPLSPNPPARSICNVSPYCLTKYPKSKPGSVRWLGSELHPSWCLLCHSCFSPKLQSHRLWIIGRKYRFHRSYRNLCQWLSRQNTYWSWRKNNTIEECQLMQYCKCCFSQKTENLTIKGH